jgi:hypothetical protein
VARLRSIEALIVPLDGDLARAASIGFRGPGA